MTHIRLWQTPGPSVFRLVYKWRPELEDISVGWKSTLNPRFQPWSVPRLVSSLWSFLAWRDSCFVLLSSIVLSRDQLWGRGRKHCGDRQTERLLQCQELIPTADSQSSVQKVKGIKSFGADNSILHLTVDAATERLILKLCVICTLLNVFNNFNVHNHSQFLDTESLQLFWWQRLMSCFQK